jgi:hypothetical protein
MQGQLRQEEPSMGPNSQNRPTHQTIAKSNVCLARKLIWETICPDELLLDSGVARHIIMTLPFK